MEKIRPDFTFSMAGVGSYLPRLIVTSDELDQRHGRSIGTSRAFGIDQRHLAAPDETSSMMAAQATQAAIKDAGWDNCQVDAIIGACGVPEQPIPGTAPLVQRRLGLGASGIPAFDVNATCLSFLPALNHALAEMRSGCWQRVVIFAADIASAGLDHDDPEASAIFGDGAVAIAIEVGGTARLLASALETYGDLADLCRLEAGGTRVRPHDDLSAFMARSRFHMEGISLFKATARLFPAFIVRLLEAAGVSIDMLDTVIPHQASAGALEHLALALGEGARDRMIDIFRSMGNQIACSMPHALATARRAGRLVPGTTSLLVGSSAGVSLGGAIIRW